MNKLALAASKPQPMIDSVILQGFVNTLLHDMTLFHDLLSATDGNLPIACLPAPKLRRNTLPPHLHGFP
jgi:hypothetical protein